MTQLGQMDPPLKPGGAPQGQALYHGNCYAPLYALDEAVPKRRATAAQKAALDRARELQYVCRRCGVRRDYPLGRGRWCEPCSYAAALYAAHTQAQHYTRRLVDDPSTRLLVVAPGPGPHEAPGAREPHAVAVVDVHRQELLHTGPAGAYGTAERGAVLDLLDGLLAEARVVHESDEDPDRAPGRLVTPPGQLMSRQYEGPHPWTDPYRESGEWADYAGRLWRCWYAWTHGEHSSRASTPRSTEYVPLLPWSRTVDPAADGLRLAELLHRIADGTEPVWEHARWLADGHGEPEPPRRRRPRATSRA